MSAASSASAAAAAAEAEEAFYALLDAATRENARHAWIYATILGSGLVVFTAMHWAWRISYTRTHLARLAKHVRPQFTGLEIGPLHILPGRTLLLMSYFTINIALSFTQIDWATGQTILAKRFGWMALMNLGLTVFLGLKNTLLSPLTGRSYETLNVLHRPCGYTTILFMILHSTIYVSGLAKADALMLLAAAPQYAAAVAGFSLLTIGVTASPFIRKRQYETFYIVHVVLGTLVLIMGKSSSTQCINDAADLR
jgi:hypothetical protein